MSVYLTKSTEWTDGDNQNVEYQVTGEMREDILKRVLRPVDDLTSVWMVQSTRPDGFLIEIFVHPFGEPQQSVYAQNLPFEERKDSQHHFFHWLFEKIQN